MFTQHESKYMYESFNATTTRQQLEEVMQYSTVSPLPIEGPKITLTISHKYSHKIIRQISRTI